MKTDTTTMIADMYELARTAQSRDGVAKEEIVEAIHEAAERLELQHAYIERLTEERDSAEKCCSMLSRINNGIILAMQSAWIAHKYGNEPADSVMEWIANSLEGPGLLPDPDDDGFTTDAQEWFDAQISEIETRSAVSGAVLATDIRARGSQ